MIYSIDVDLDQTTIEMREIAYVFPCEAMMLMHTTISVFDGLLFRNFSKQGVAVWNPWLTQLGWIEYVDKDFRFCGVGYDTSLSGKCYKILSSFFGFRKVTDSLQVGYHRVAIYECASHALKFLDEPFEQWPYMDPLSVNGNLYWVAYNPKIQDSCIQSFDFSKEIFKPFCLLPFQKKNSLSQVVLAVFKGDRFSLFKQCYETTKVEIWVTKMKIDIEEEVVWIKFMNFPTTNLPILANKVGGISYFIFDKTLIMCCGETETGAACIYFVRADMFKKIQRQSEYVRFYHCVHLPNLISVPLEFRLHQV